MENIFVSTLKCVKDRRQALKDKVLGIKNPSLFTKFVELLYVLEYSLAESTDKSGIRSFREEVQNQYEDSTKKGEPNEELYPLMSPDVFLLLNGATLKSIHELIKSVM